MSGSKAPKLQVNDEDNKSQNATINRIQRYRDDLAEYQLLFAQNELSEEISERQQHRAYHQLAKGFLQLLKPYLTAEEIQQGEHYWNEVDLGSFMIEPPEAIQQPSKQEMESALKAGHKQTFARADPRNEVEAKRYRVIGLRDFAAAEPEWQVEWSVMYGPEVSPADLRSEIRDSRVRVQPRSHRNEPITVIRSGRVPRQIIDNVVTELENFVRAVGMDVDIEAEAYMGEGGPGI